MSPCLSNKRNSFIGCPLRKTVRAKRGTSKISDNTHGTNLHTSIMKTEASRTTHHKRNLSPNSQDLSPNFNKINDQITSSKRRKVTESTILKTEKNSENVKILMSAFSHVQNEVNTCRYMLRPRKPVDYKLSRTSFGKTTGKASSQAKSKCHKKTTKPSSNARKRSRMEDNNEHENLDENKISVSKKKRVGDAVAAAAAENANVIPPRYFLRPRKTVDYTNRKIPRKCISETVEPTKRKRAASDDNVNAKRSCTNHSTVGSISVHHQGKRRETKSNCKACLRNEVSRTSWVESLHQVVTTCNDMNQHYSTASVPGGQYNFYGNCAQWEQNCFSHQELVPLDESRLYAPMLTAEFYTNCCNMVSYAVPGNTFRMSHMHNLLPPSFVGGTQGDYHFETLGTPNPNSCAGWNNMEEKYWEQSPPFTPASIDEHHTMFGDLGTAPDNVFRDASLWEEFSSTFNFTSGRLPGDSIYHESTPCAELTPVPKEALEACAGWIEFSKNAVCQRNDGTRLEQDPFSWHTEAPPSPYIEIVECDFESDASAA